MSSIYLSVTLDVLSHNLGLKCKSLVFVWSGCRYFSSPSASEVWGPQTWSACSPGRPPRRRLPGARAGSSCWRRWTEVETAWRAPTGRWRPSSSSRWSNCCSWLIAPLSKPCWFALELPQGEANNKNNLYAYLYKNMHVMSNGRRMWTGNKLNKIK